MVFRTGAMRVLNLSTGWNENNEDLPGWKDPDR